MRINLMVQTKMENYDVWYKEGFSQDAERRSQMCDESKTVVAKVSDTEAVILLFDVDIDKLRKHMKDPIMQTLENKFKAKHIVNTFSPID